MKRIICMLTISALLAGTAVFTAGCGGTEEEIEVITVDEEDMLGDTNVEEVENAKHFDPFEGIYMECYGVDGYVSVEFIFDDSYYDETAYTIMGATDELSEGDEVTVSVSELATQQTEESEGLTPTETSKTFMVTAECRYITNANDVTEDFINEYKDYFLGVIYDNSGDENAPEILSAEYIGYKFAVNEYPSTERGTNRMIFYYSVLAAGSEDTEERDYAALNLVIYKDGTVACENTEVSGELPDDYVILADTVTR